MPWVIEAYADIGMHYWPDGSSCQVLDEGERGILAEGKDPELLARDFCIKYVIPTVLKHGVSTYREVMDCWDNFLYREILDIYLMNPADMFWPPSELSIHNTETGEKYYPHSTQCDLRENVGPPECVGTACYCRCDCKAREELKRNLQNRVSALQAEQKIFYQNQGALQTPEFYKNIVAELLRDLLDSTDEEVYNFLEEFDDRINS